MSIDAYLQDLEWKQLMSSFLEVRKQEIASSDKEIPSIDQRESSESIDLAFISEERRNNVGWAKYDEQGWQSS